LLGKAYTYLRYAILLLAFVLVDGDPGS